MTTNNENRNDNRKKQVTFGVITAAVIIVIILLLRSCSAGNGNESYTMKLNGDNPFEIAMGEQYVDPGVTFFDEDGDPVPEDKQSELEQKLTITNEVDTSKAGEYLVTYEYNKQTLERTVKVLAGSNSNTPGDNTDKNTGDKDNQQGTTGNETSTTPEPSDSNNNGNNGNSTTDKPGTSGEGTGTQTTPTPGPGNNDDDNNNDNDDNTEPEKKVYYLTNTRYNSRTVTYNGEEFTLTATNVPYGIIPIYTNNSGTNAGRYDSEVVFVLSDALKSQYSSIEPASMTATLTIRQAKPSYTVPTGLTANVGDTLADVKLPKGFSFEKSLTTSVGGVGYHTFYVTYTPDDTINYQTVHHIAVVIKVTDPSGGDDDKVVYYLPSNTFFNNRTVTYNGSSYSIFAENVPANINVRYVNNTGTDAGTYNAIVYYTVGEALKDQCSRVEPSSMRATLTILKAVPRYTVPTGLTAYVGQTLKDVTLPKGFTFEDPLTTSVGNVGARTFKVTYTPEDTKNYEIVTGIDVTITVTQKPGPGPDPVKPVYKLPSNVTFPDVNEVYTGQTYTAEAVNVPTGIIATYSNATRSDAGTQQATVVFSLSDSMAKLYSGVEPASMTATISIAQATPSYTVPTNLTAQEGQTLADVRNQLGTGFAFEDPLSTSVGPVGDNDFTVTYNPGNTNYKTVTGIKVTIHVTKTPDPTKPKYTIPATVGFNDLSGPYTGSEYVLEATNVPDVLTAVYSNNRRTEIGSQEATVTFALNNKGLESYSGIEGSNTMTAILNVTKAKPTYTAPGTLTAVEGQTLADIAGQLGTGFSFEDPLSTAVGAPGDHEFTVSYTPDDTTHYEVVTGIKVTVHVTKAPDPSKPKYTIPATVGFNDLTGPYTGNEYVLEATNVPDVLTAVYTNNRRTVFGSQTATVTFSLSSKGVEEYSGIEGSNTMTAILSVTKATPSYTVPTNLTAQEGQTLADVAGQLGTGFSFEAPLSTSVGSVGSNPFMVTYTPGDTTNYEIVTGIEVTIQVTAKPVKPTLELPKPGTFDDVKLPYTGTSQTITAKGLPAGVLAQYTNNVRTEIGSQTATVTFSLSPELQEQYSGISPSSMTATLEIIKAAPSYTTPGTLTAEEGQTLADIAVQLGTGFSFEDPLNTSVGSAGSHQFAVTYTPDDTAHYEVITGIMVTVQVTAKTEPPVVDKTELQKAKDIADGITNFGYTFDSYVAFTEAYEKASQMPESTQDEVDKKTASIKSALALLKSSGGTDVPEYPDNVDKTALQEAIDKANAVTSFGYTVESYTAFTEAYEKASQLPEVTQAEIIAKTDAINAALALLVSSSGSDPDHNENVDKAALNEATARAEAVTGFGYTVESYEAFATAYATASSLPEDTQEQINTKADAINTALALLVSSSDSDPDHTENVNKDALEAAKNDADAITGFGYTVESYEAFESAYASALALHEDTQEEIDNKVSAIRAAISLLVSSSFTPDYSENETAATLSDATSTALDEASTLVEETIIDEEDAKGEEEEVVEEEDVPEEDSEPQDSQPIDAIPNEIVVEDPANNYKQDELTYSENDDPNKEDSEENSNNDEGGDESEDAAIPEGDGEAE